MKMSMIDYTFYSMCTEVRPLDFCLLGKLKKKEFDTLTQGAQKAFSSYPKTCKKINGFSWDGEGHAWRISKQSLENKEEVIKHTGMLLKKKMNLKKKRAIEQSFFKTHDGDFLMTRCHHSLGDLTSLLLWMNSQMNNLAVKESSLTLRNIEKKNKVSPYRFEKNSPPFGAKKNVPNGKRQWKDYVISQPIIDFTLKEYSYNDFLLACLFLSMNKWNKKRQSKQELSIYVPTNIRENRLVGFGNGSTRYKIYHCERNDFEATVEHIRKQVNWCRENGMWAINNKLIKIPLFIYRAILRRLSTKASADLCSTIFSHFEVPKNFKGLFDHFESLSIISQLYEHYKIVFAMRTDEGISNLTATWDEAHLSEEEVDELIKYFILFIKEGEKECQ